MIRILSNISTLNEANSSTNDLTDKEIQSLYDNQKLRVQNKVNEVINFLIETLSECEESITNEIIHDYIYDFYFDKEELIIISKDNFEERIEEIKNIKKLQSADDSIIESNITDAIKNILFNE